MEVEDPKYNWRSPFVILVGTILSFADPITDILTLVEFYRADHMIWFGVGLTFVILPCFVFLALFFLLRIQGNQYSVTRQCWQTLLCGFHPFSAAFARLQQFVSALKWLCGSEIDSDSKKEADDLQLHVQYAVMFESVLESVPQLIIQLYAASVQEEPVDIIQIISLPVSFLCLVWAFTIADEVMNKGIIDKPKVKHKLIFFVTHFFLLSSRLVAVCYFTVSYKWWVIGVLLLHTVLIITVGNIWIYQTDSPHSDCVTVVIFSVFFFCFHWLRDDLFVRAMESVETNFAHAKIELKIMQLLSNGLFVLENLVMILLFYYYSQYSNNWYTVPVTVCVCLFTVLGSVMRVTYFRILLKQRIDVLR